MKRVIQLVLCGGILVVLAFVILLARSVYAVTTAARARAVGYSDHVPEAMGMLWTTAFVGVALTAALAVTILWRKRA